MKRLTFCTVGFCLLFTSTQAQTDSIVRVGACETPGTAWGVCAQEQIVYIADLGAFTIIDATVPSAPAVLSSLDTPFTNALGVFVIDTLAYLHTSNKLSVINVSNPDIPTVAGWCYIPIFGGQYPNGVWVTDTLCYISRGSEGLITVNVANADSPFVIDTFDTPGCAIDLFVQDTIAYIADRESLQVVSVADPTEPYRISSCEMSHRCYDVFVVDTLAFVACEGGYNGRTVVVNVAIPSTPFIVDQCNLRADGYAVFVVGPNVYVATADYWEGKKGEETTVAPLKRPDGKADVEGGIRVMNVSNPDSIYLTVSYDTPGDPRDLYVADTFIYVADYDSLLILKHLAIGTEETPAVPEIASLELVQNEPNPCNQSTVISYQIPLTNDDQQSTVSLNIYDLAGRPIKTFTDLRNQGVLSRKRPSVEGNRIVWDGRDETGRLVPDGTYLCRLVAGTYSVTRKMVVVRSKQ